MKKLYQADKITAAGCQLDTAIELLFDGRDPVSAAVLIHGAWNITKDLLAKKGIETSHTWMMELRPNLKENEVYNELNQVWNFCKHADKDPDKMIQFSLEYVESALMLALYDFSQLSHSKSKTMDVYELWFIAKNEKFYKTSYEEVFAAASTLFPGLAALSSKEQAKAGLDVIIAFR